MFTNIHMVAVPFIKRGVLDSEVIPTLKRNLKVAATWKTAAPKSRRKRDSERSLGRGL